MKKVLILGLSLIILTGCNGKEEKRLQAMERYGKEYYQSYGKQYDVDEYTVSLKQLREAKKQLKQDYDLTALEKCQDTTKIIFTIKEKKIKDFKINLDC